MSENEFFHEIKRDGMTSLHGASINAATFVILNVRNEAYVMFAIISDSYLPFIDPFQQTASELGLQSSSAKCYCPSKTYQV